MRQVKGVRGQYEGHKVFKWGMRLVQGVRRVRGGYKGYEVGMRGTRWVQGV